LAVRSTTIAFLCLLLAASSGASVLAADDSPISVSSISASFYLNPTNSASFIASPSTPVAFTQDFPALNFNPVSGTVKCSNAVNVSPETRPFTDVVPQADGSCKTSVAEGNKLQAGVGDMTNFQAVLTGSFLVATAGRVTFNFYSDDGWILSIGPNTSGGDQPAYVSGPRVNFPRVGPFTGYTIVGSYNVESPPNQNNLVVSFPAAGNYPFELDYSDCCEGTLALTALANGVPIPPTTALALDVKGVTESGQVQGKQHIDVVATAGQAQQVEFLVDGQSRGIVKTPPFAFDWDASQESPGAHKLTFRGVDASGGTIDKQVNLQVLTAAAGATAVPTAASVPPTTQDNANTTIVIAAATVLILALVGAGLFFFLVYRGSRKPVPVAPVPAAAPEPVLTPDDKTEYLGKMSAGDLTIVSNHRPQVMPKARLLLKPDREIEVSRNTETVIGRDSSNLAYIDDRQVSRHHARISCVDGDFWIEDLNSLNGTRVNGAAVTKQKLADNDQINVGDTLITFALEA
jgi:FHA domain-containing protein/Big-like domain-containing protein